MVVGKLILPFVLINKSQKPLAFCPLACYNVSMKNTNTPDTLSLSLSDIQALSEQAGNLTRNLWGNLWACAEADDALELYKQVRRLIPINNETGKRSGSYDAHLSIR